MDSAAFVGIFIVLVAGLMMGSVAWPVKLMQRFKYEHWAFCAMTTGLVILPWTITLIWCPNAIEAYKTIDVSVLLKSNLFSLSWGLANVLGLLCLLRIGFCLSNGILTGIGVSLGVTIPMIFKGSGLFKDSADIISKPGIVVIVAVVIMLIGVILASKAGFARAQDLRATEQKSGSFLGGLMMIVIAGILSCGISFAFVYSQGPVKDAMKAYGAGDIPATFAVWAIGLIGGALINILYPAFLITKNKSWKIFIAHPREIFLSLIIGLNLCISIALMGKGMVLLGALGASVGFGLQQAMQMLGGQAIGFIAGEWQGVANKTRRTMYMAIAVLIIAAIVMAYGNSLL